MTFNSFFLDKPKRVQQLDRYTWKRTISCRGTGGANQWLDGIASGSSPILAHCPPNTHVFYSLINVLLLQNEIENLKQAIADMEEKVQYQSDERLRDVNEVLENCQTRVSSINHTPPHKLRNPQPELKTSTSLPTYADIENGAYVAAAICHRRGHW